MSDKLTEIMAWKRQEIAPLLRPVSESELVRLDASLPPPPPFAAALRRGDGRLAVISEIKRRSPSAGDIAPGASAVEQAERYRAAGADALSILTDKKYFGGSLDDLRSVTAHFRSKATLGATPARLLEMSGSNLTGTSEARAPTMGQSNPPLLSFPNPCPCLRKDFFVHPVQVLQAREAGAGAILIIVRALTDDEIKALFAAATAAGLDAIFEIHHESEIARAERQGAKIIGVNNRDLAVFKTDLGLSERLIPKFPPGVIAVSESGIFNGTDAARVRAAGAHAVLVGEALMKAADPTALIEEFRHV